MSNHESQKDFFSFVVLGESKKAGCSTEHNTENQIVEFSNLNYFLSRVS